MRIRLLSKNVPLRVEEREREGEEWALDSVFFFFFSSPKLCVVGGGGPFVAGFGSGV